MFDVQKMYRQIPMLIEQDGLVTVLTDINGNEFDANVLGEGSELTVDYPQESGKGLRVIDYKICSDNTGRKFWREVVRRQWITDPKYGFCGKWDSEWR